MRYVNNCCVALFAILFGCGVDVENPSPPQVPVMVEKTKISDWPEGGIDAVSNNTIRVVWENSDLEVESFKLYRGIGVDSDIPAMQLLAIIPANEGREEVAFEDTGLEQDVFHYYSVRAQNFAGDLSLSSDTVRYMLLNLGWIFSMYPVSIRDTLRMNILSWNYYIHTNMELYCITIKGQGEPDVLHRNTFLPGNYVGMEEEYLIPDTVLSRMDNGVYEWRIEILSLIENEIESAGAESDWGQFYYAQPQ